DDGDGRAGKISLRLKTQLGRVRQIDLEKIAAGDRSAAGVAKVERGEVHAQRVDVERVGENVDADVVVVIEIAAVAVDEDFDHLGVRRPAAEAVAEFVDKRVVEQRAVVIPRAGEHPTAELAEAGER